MGNLSVASELTDEEALRQFTATAFDSMLHAAAFITKNEAEGKIISYDGTAEVPVDPRALSILVDTALAEPTPQLPMMHTDSMHRTLPHQQPPVHLGPTDPRSFILPRPTPTQPRRLLPARGMGLPDPFAMNGPPQLPPPPGSNFARLPLPGYLPPPGHGPSGHAPGHPSGHAPGPGHAPPGHGPPGPPSLYFPPPGPHPRRY